jgi:hypothetical protein
VLGTDFKRGLFPLIDTLLDESWNWASMFWVFEAFGLQPTRGDCSPCSRRSFSRTGFYWCRTLNSIKRWLW